MEKFYMSNFIIFFSFLGCIVFGIMSLISLFRKNGKAKKNGIISAGLFMTMLISAITSSDSTKPTNAAAKVQTASVAIDPDAEVKAKAQGETKLKEEEDGKAKAEADVKAKQEEEENNKKAIQEAILDFEKSAYALDATVKPIMTKYQEVMAGFGKTSNINDAYEAASNAKNAAQNLTLAFSRLPISDKLDNETKKMLQEARTNLSTAYYTKMKSFDAVMEYLDNKKPSSLQKFKDDTKSSDQFTLAGVAKILEAKTKVGIDVAKQQ